VGVEDVGVSNMVSTDTEDGIGGKLSSCLKVTINCPDVGQVWNYSSY